MKKEKEERQPRALIYCRVSGDAQEKEGSSLDSQAELSKEYARKQGYDVTAVVRETFSGAYLYDRPLLNAEREKIRNREYDVMIVYAIDRLSRDQLQLPVIWEECQRSGTRLESVTENIEDTPQGRFLVLVGAFFGEAERLKIKERCVRGKRTKALQGMLNNATDLYGYTTVNKRRVIKDAEAEIVKRIYQEYLNGKSIRGLADWLNNEGILSPACGKRNLASEPIWGKSTIARILTEPAYYGKSFSWRYRGVSGFENGERFNRIEIRDRSEWIALPDSVTPAIVSAETWQAVQERLERNKGIARPNVECEVLFRGMVECAACGSNMYWEKERGQRGIFRCAARCGASRINADKCEDAIWNELAEVIRNPQIIKNEMKRRKEDGGQGRRSIEKEIESKKASLVRIENDITRISRRASEIEDELVYATFMGQAASKRQERERLVAGIALAEENLVLFDAERTGVKDATSYFKRVSRKLDKFGFSDKKTAVDALGVKIVGNGKDLLVRYSLPFEKQELRSDNVVHRAAGIGQDDAGKAVADDPAAARI